MTPPPPRLPPADASIFASALSRAAIDRALAAPRFEVLGKIGVDLGPSSTPGTADLPRRRRILVPVDVQALVSPAGAPMAVVPLTGRQGTRRRSRQPPRLLSASTCTGRCRTHCWPAATTDATQDLSMPPLPDTWVVVRTLLPVGRRTVQATGWVIDAAARR